tara:strand:+ start:961 stop:1152 length:192 start_codon:yes stop_codon:yes gene_type:complete
MGQSSLPNCRKKSHAEFDTEFRMLRCLLADQVQGGGWEEALMPGNYRAFNRHRSERRFYVVVK